MWGFFQRLFYGRSGQPSSIPVSKRRFVHIENIDHTIIMKQESKIVRPPIFDQITKIKRPVNIVSIKKDGIAKIKNTKNVVIVRD